MICTARRGRDAVHRRARNYSNVPIQPQALDEFLAAYEAERGGITEGEMRDAARRARERATVIRGNPEQRSPGPARQGSCLMLMLDAGALVAVEHGSRDVVALIKRARLAGRPPVTSGGVVARVWHGGSGRQVPMARLLAGTDVAPVDDRLGRRAGMLLAPQRPLRCH
jgi:hypothetical protein